MSKYRGYVGAYEIDYFDIYKAEDSFNGFFSGSHCLLLNNFWSIKVGTSFIFYEISVLWLSFFMYRNIINSCLIINFIFLNINLTELITDDIILMIG